MQKGIKLTFFMLVTNRDCILADYAIRSYKKIYEQKRPYGKDEFVLYVYLNCLSEENKQTYISKWQLYPFAVLYDNAERINEHNRPFPGEEIISPEGIKRKRDDYAENYDELWTSELKKFNTPYIATVDADFEVLDADFYFYLMEQLDGNKDIIGASSSYDATSEVFDAYSRRDILLHERNHTWFCIYRKEAFTLSHISHFYFEEPDANGKISAYDSAAYFQQDLRKNHRLTFITAPHVYRNSFVHYRSASKNRSLNKNNIAFYRRVFLLSAIGLIPGQEKNLVSRLINKIARKIGYKVFKSYIRKLAAERSTYIYDDPQPKEVKVKG